MIFPSVNRITPFANPTDESDALTTIRDAYTSQRDAIYPMHTEWYVQILFAHGLQNVNINMMTGTPVFNGYLSTAYAKPRVAWNLIDSAARRLRGMLLQRSAEIDVRAVTDDERDIQAAKVADRLVDWAYEYHGIAEIESELADWLVKTGNGILYLAWDPNAGDSLNTADGGSVKTGGPVVLCDSPFRWIFDPRVTRLRDAKWALRMTYQTQEFVEEHFPTASLLFANRTGTNAYFNSWEFNLMNTTPMHAGIGMQTNLRDKGLIRFFELFEVPCPRYPEGRVIVAAGFGETPEIILAEGTNPHRAIPAVLFRLSPVAGRIWGETPLKYMLSPQREINRRRTQIIRNGDLVGNAKLVTPEAKFDPRQLNNEVGGAYECANDSPWQPYYLQPPALGDYVFESEKAAIAMMNMMLEPTTLTPMENVGKANSAIQIQQIVDVQAMLAKPYHREWELGWESFWRGYIQMFRMHANYPIHIASLGSEAVAGWPFVSNRLLSEGIALRIVPGSTLPQTPSAAMAAWFEMFKSGAASPLNPEEKRRFWNDIGKGDMARTMRDMNAQRDKAYRNLTRLRNGMLIQPDEMVDDPEVHLTAMQDWMSTSDYEVWRATHPPQFDMNLRLTMQQYAMLQQTIEQRMLEQQMAAAGPPAAGGKPSAASKVMGQAQAIGPGNPMGGANPTMSQGFAKRPNPYRNPGGAGQKTP